MRITTWNVNSVNARIEHLIKFIKKDQSDIYMIQELKCTNETFPIKEIEKLSSDVAKQGLDAEIKKEKVLNIARELLKIARNSLVERKFLDSLGNNESGYLSVLEEILQKKASPARELIYNFSNKNMVYL